MKRKVILKAPVLSMSGYGVHARFVLRALRKFENLFEIYIMNLNWGKTGFHYEDTEERRFIDQKIEDTIHYISNGGKFDMSLQVTIPQEFENMAPVNIGCTAGTETTKISPKWLEMSNYMTKIIVVSNYTKFAFDNTEYQLRNQETGDLLQTLKVKTPVEVVNYCVWPELTKSHYETLDFEKFQFITDFNFLAVAQWSPRKNIENLLTWFIEEFHEDENVGMILKTSIANDSIIDREYTLERIENIVNSFPNKKCKIYAIHGKLNDEEMVTLYNHPKVSSYISLAHGEGFNLSCFESVMNDLPVICPKWGGQTDFLVQNEKDMFLPVDFDIQPIQPEAVWDGVLEKDSHWCFPKEKSAKSSMREMVNNLELYKELAKSQGSYVRENFSELEQYEKFIKCLGVNLEVNKKIEEL